MDYLNSIGKPASSTKSASCSKRTTDSTNSPRRPVPSSAVSRTGFLVATRTHSEGRSKTDIKIQTHHHPLAIWHVTLPAEAIVEFSWLHIVVTTFLLNRNSNVSLSPLCVSIGAMCNVTCVADKARALDFSQPRLTACNGKPKDLPGDERVGRVLASGRHLTGTRMTEPTCSSSKMAKVVAVVYVGGRLLLNTSGLA
ncbi:hypothetical protein V5799_010100 [Amblyomma americanum]|uniref:Uncharacterized protein n=1 Tax=Amblyomma americanum TaxID=6943 RepID=A0AAQ4FA55_AMBAM